MKKIDLNNLKYVLMVDTETIGTITMKESVVPFEIGFKVYDIQEDKIIKEKSLLVRKFFNNIYIMRSCFSAKKYPSYERKLANDKRYKLASIQEIANTLEKYIKKYNISIMVAHNAQFDKEAIERLFKENNVKNPLTKIDLLDTREVSKIITYSSKYSAFCWCNRDKKIENNESKFITKTGRVRTTAEAIYCYLAQNPDFNEAHNALDDIDIEIEILKCSYLDLGNTMVNLNTAPDWRDYSVILSDEDD